MKASGMCAGASNGAGIVMKRGVLLLTLVRRTAESADLTLSTIPSRRRTWWPLRLRHCWKLGCSTFWLWLRRGTSPAIAALGILSGNAIALTRVDAVSAGRA